jgi:antitoxin ParD1/3/4
MASTGKRTITLPADQARYVDSLVASGRYASESDVISSGLRAVQEREAGMERWLREEVVPVYDAMQADPGRTIPASRVTALLDALHAERLKAAGNGTERRLRAGSR